MVEMDELLDLVVTEGVSDLHLEAKCAVFGLIHNDGLVLRLANRHFFVHVFTYLMNTGAKLRNIYDITK